MNLFIFDYEVFAYDWIIVAKRPGEDKYYVYHNDYDSVIAFMEEYDPLLCGFNCKHYDQFIHRGVLSGLAPEEIKRINDYIIVEGNEGWTYPFPAKTPRLKMTDLMDDCQQGLSLKAIEAHLGMDIRETTVPFDIDRPLTDGELEEVTFYCKHDVDATERLYELRQNYLNTKIWLGSAKGLSPEDALYLTNAKLTAVYLDAHRTEDFNDERDYVYPDNLLREYIPKEVTDFFDRLHNTAFSDEEVFKGAKYEFPIGKCECKIGWGGIHGAIPTYREKATSTRSIRNQDVASYYPHLLTIEGYISRNIPDGSLYADMLETRMRAKRSGDKEKANALKLVANTTYGGMLNRYNDLYDAKHARSVCITGQLRLLELANHLVAECPSLIIVQLNTDGIMVSLDDTDVPKYTEICTEWQTRTGYELEEDCIQEIIQKDVNNYIEIATDGSSKIKGGALVRGIAPAGAFNVNNNAVVISRAIVDYFVKGVPVEKTIMGDDTVLDFQLIAKASGKYSKVYHYINGKPVPVQKCNRVYATSDPAYGTLTKIHRDTGSECKVGGLPDNCILDNSNELSIHDINKSWYIRRAEELINDFLGTPEEIQITLTEGVKEMANTKPESESKENIFQKLLLIRTEWGAVETSKSGVNLHAEFKYFELEDIVPKAFPILMKLHCLYLITFPEHRALGTLIDTDSGEKIEFEAPFTLIGDPAKFRMNEIQGTGAAITYYRRYLYALMLDLLDKDKIDADVLPLKPATASRPATTEQRAEIVTEITQHSVTDPADELQITALKNAMQKLLELDPAAEEDLQAIVVKTNALTEISKSQAEEYLTVIKAMIDDAEDNL